MEVSGWIPVFMKIKIIKIAASGICNDRETEEIHRDDNFHIRLQHLHKSVVF